MKFPGMWGALSAPGMGSTFTGTFLSLGGDLCHFGGLWLLQGLEHRQCTLGKVLGGATFIWELVVSSVPLDSGGQH